MKLLPTEPWQVAQWAGQAAVACLGLKAIFVAWLPDYSDPVLPPLGASVKVSVETGTEGGPQVDPKDAAQVWPMWAIRMHHVIDQCHVAMAGVDFQVSYEATQTGENSRLFVRVVQTDTVDVRTGEREGQAGRKWRLSPHMTDGEVVQTCLMALLAFWEHECREAFTFLGARVASPALQRVSIGEAASNGCGRTREGVNRNANSGHPSGRRWLRHSGVPLGRCYQGVRQLDV